MNSRVIPPQGKVLLAIVAIQLGAALSVGLFPALGVDGTVAVRIIFSAILLCLVARMRVLVFAKIFVQHWIVLLGFGVALAEMYYCFYQALARIPLGVTVAFEFVGPLGVAALTSRRLIHFAWIGLAVLGIVLLTPISGSDMDPLGILFALLAGGGWAAFIVLSGKIGAKIPGNDGLAIGMIVAAIAMTPLVIPVAGELFSDPMVLLLGLAVALLATTIPFTLEFQALQQLPARTYGILVSVEPAVAAVIGALFLGDHIGGQGIIAIACVVTAAVGITLSDGKGSVTHDH